MLHFSNEGISLAYEVHGAGQPVVMLHGAAVTFTGNFDACGWIDPLTTRGLQVIGLDFRGHGASDKPADATLHGTTALTSDVIALLDHLDIDQACLVGFSIGTTIGLHALHTHPKRFRAAALVATGEGIIGSGAYQFPAILPPLVDVLRLPETPSDASPGHVIYSMMAEQVAGDRAGVAAALAGEYPPCSVDEAASVDIPVLVVSGDEDVVLGQGRRLAETLPRSRYLEIAGANHFSLAVDESVQQAVAEFLTNDKGR